MDYSSIEKFVADEYPRVSESDLRDLIAEASVFLDQQGLTAIAKEVAQSLSDYLAEYHKRQRSFKAGRDTTRSWREQSFSEIPEPFDTHISEDEKISAIAKAPIFDLSREVKKEIEEALADFERKKKNLQFLLPLTVFEALERRLVPDAPIRWTAGFEGTGLFVLHRRARIRMEWKDNT